MKTRDRLRCAPAVLLATACGATPEPDNQDDIAADSPAAETANGGSLASTDACDLDTGFPGDDTCLLPPEPGTGDQFHYGPSDYDDPDEVARYVLEPGGEVLDCQYMNARNEEIVYYRDFTNSLRPSSHHMIVNELAENVENGFRECDGFQAHLSPRLMGGTTVARTAAGGEAPEDQGLANRLGANAQVEMQLHYFNTTDEPLLREAWMNIVYMDEAEATQMIEPVQGYGNVAMAIPPGAHETWRSRMTAPRDLRLVDIYSHFHANTVRMSAWRVRESGERTLLYETYDWEEPGVLALNSVVENPRPDPDTRTMGGYSGIVELQRGDSLEWECEVVNGRQVVLEFANKALDAEMCNLRGNYAPSFGGQWLARTPGWKCGDDAPCER